MGIEQSRNMKHYCGNSIDSEVFPLHYDSNKERAKALKAAVQKKYSDLETSNARGVELSLWGGPWQFMGDSRILVVDDEPDFLATVQGYWKNADLRS